MREAWKVIMENSLKYKADAEIDGLAISRWLPGLLKSSLALSTTLPSTYLMFGLGGIFVEIMKDVTFKLLRSTKKPH